jgi:hypothetical protein
VGNFKEAASERPSGTFLSNFWDFLTHSKKWRLLPIVVVLLLLGVLIMLSGTATAPFIYTLF